MEEGVAEEWAKYWEADSEELRADVASLLESGRAAQGKAIRW